MASSGPEAMAITPSEAPSSNVPAGPSWEAARNRSTNSGGEASAACSRGVLFAATIGM